jgi:hypothetical protein
MYYISSQVHLPVASEGNVAAVLIYNLFKNTIKKRRGSLPHTLVNTHTHNTSSLSDFLAVVRFCGFSCCFRPS